ncbi:MAG: hypothetical protein NVS9B4_03220 [Candidatus Acidiferrum sp.]
MRPLLPPVLACSLFISAAFYNHPNATAQAHADTPAGAPTDAETHALFDRVIENQKADEAALDTYERLERTEIRKTGPTPGQEVKVTRVVPAGTGVDHIPVGPDGKPGDLSAYRAELEKLEKALAWAAETGHAQHEAYEKIAKRRKDRANLIQSARDAFLFTFVARENRGGRLMLKYRMDPNPSFKPTSRVTYVYTRVRGVVWIDQQSAELAHIEGEVIDDISLGIFLAKVYKGSHFLQDRSEIAPAVWQPFFSQYDFDGRKFLMSFSFHERSYYSNYRLIGSPPQALASIRAELAKLPRPAANR